MTVPVEISSSMTAQTKVAGCTYTVEIEPRRKAYLRTDMTLVTLVYNSGEELIFDRVEGGGRGEALTLHRLRCSDDAADIAHLIGLEEPVEVICQPMRGPKVLTGDALVYQGNLSTVRPDILDCQRADAAYLTVSLDEWDVRRREQGDE